MNSLLTAGTGYCITMELCTTMARQMQLKFEVANWSQTVGLRITPSGDLNCTLTVFIKVLYVLVCLLMVFLTGELLMYLAKVQLITPKEAIPKSSVSMNSRQSAVPV